MKSFIYKIILTFFLANSLLAQNLPIIFSSLGTPLFKSANTLSALAKLEAFTNEKDKIVRFVKDAKLLLKEGFLVDESQNKKEIKDYLKALRDLQKQYDAIEKIYKHKLYMSIYEENIDDFYILVHIPLSFISSDARLKEKVVNFYKEHKHKNIPYLNALSKDFDLDEASYAYLDKMFQVHQENQQIESVQSLDTFRPSATIKKPIRVVSVKHDGGFDIYLENNSYSDVTIRLLAKNIVNMNASASLPLIASFSARSRTKVLHFSRIDVHKKSSFQMIYSSTLGRLNPNYNEKYLYALPYSRGDSYILTQGFNGSQTHKGRSAYALDFNMPIGSPVHAMRGGIVIAVESENTEHGFSPEFSSKANHIIIAHDDGSMAMYGHLNTGGVRVKLGDNVYQHQHIGYSGNTGYSSGPHLHVHISTLQSFSKGTSSVRFRFKAKRGRIKKPVVKTSYTAI